MDRVWWYDAMGCLESDVACYKQWKTIHVTAMIPAFMSIIACLFIIFTGIKYHTLLSKVAFGAQFPIFLSICDLLWELSHTADHLHNYIQGYVSEGVLCQLFGCMKPFAINCQTMWTLCVSFYLNRMIFSSATTAPSFGKHNIYLHIACWGPPFIILLFGFAFNVYGPEGPWCGIADATTDIFMVDVWMILTILILIINYGWITYKIRKIIKQTESEDGDHINIAVQKTHENMKRLIRTIGLYPVAYFSQWLAYALFKSYAVPRTFGTALWVVLTGNAGGMFNLCLYGPMLFNQIKRQNRKNQKMMSQLQTKASTESATAVVGSKSSKTTMQSNPSTSKTQTELIDANATLSEIRMSVEISSSAK